VVPETADAADPSAVALADGRRTDRGAPE
jgi:hypothetical protein